MPDRTRDPYKRANSTHLIRSYEGAYASRDQLSRVPSEASMSSRSPSPRPRRSRDRPQHRSRRYPSHSRSPSPRPRTRRNSMQDVFMPLPEDKPWFKKKTLWATLASAATIVAVYPTWRSANGSIASAKGSLRSADASTRSADAAEKAAHASLRAARAVERSTKAVERSADAVVNTAVASGHQDHHGRYLGPRRGEKRGGGGGDPEKRSRSRSDRSTDHSRGRSGRQQRQLEYAPIKSMFNADGLPVGVPVKAG